MGAIGRVMDESEKQSEGAVALLLKEHAVVLGRVAMAMLGEDAEVKRVLEQVARDAGAKSPPERASARAWLLGLVRAACASRTTKLPLRRSHGNSAPDGQPRPANAREPATARTALGALRPTEREAVVLSLVGGLDLKDVAFACNVDVATARRRLGHGIDELLGATTAGDGEGGVQ